MEVDLLVAVEVVANLKTALRVLGRAEKRVLARLRERLRRSFLRL